MSPLSDIWFANIFCSSVDFFFTFLMLSFEVKCFLILMKFHCYHFFLCCLCFSCHILKKSDIPKIKIITLTFFLKSLSALTLAFISMVCFELIFTYGVRKKVRFHSPICDIQLSQDHLLKVTLSVLNHLGMLSKINWP